MYALRILEEGGSETGLGFYVWVALVIFFLMVFLGWIVASKGWLKNQEESSQSNGGHDDLHGSDHLDKKVALSTNNKKADDLTQLEGIGPKVAKVLAEVGITSFDDLAKADYNLIKKAVDAAGYKYMDPAGWIEQAVFAAKGDKTGLENLQNDLKGGRKVS